MHAQPGDWLLVESRTTERHARRAAILAVGPHGEPPFTVRWTDDDREAIVFPGPDARVLTPEAIGHIDRAAAERASAVQNTIAAGQATIRRPG